MEISVTEGTVWGGQSWQDLVADAFAFMGPLQGQSVLELGFRDAQMSFAFARRGASVVGVEVDECSVKTATIEAVRLGLAARFLRYDGDLDSVPGAYDIVFTKSVLVLTDLDVMLPAICRKLKPGGRVVFIENGAGSWLMRAARYLLRPPRVWKGVRYFTDDHIAKISAAFAHVQIRRSHLPPVYLITGHKL